MAQCLQPYNNAMSPQRVCHNYMFDAWTKKDNFAQYAKDEVLPGLEPGTFSRHGLCAPPNSTQFNQPPLRTLAVRLFSTHPLFLHLWIPFLRHLEAKRIFPDFKLIVHYGTRSTFVDKGAKPPSASELIQHLSKVDPKNPQNRMTLVITSYATP
ncbi:unnamed protein product [Fusarium venenatum]|uniref:Uncharacterized protein n=1 Tax=Fusarium venenatum TaxID=56646 RepID=A0A2L2TJ85_9HYPO|nr:uncharacterized protein FVRRES_08170 [Fusarium venenatum]CEI68093.1 unnamed protein product [Fusarium venenatum]